MPRMSFLGDDAKHHDTASGAIPIRISLLVASVEVVIEALPGESIRLHVVRIVSSNVRIVHISAPGITRQIPYPIVCSLGGRHLHKQVLQPFFRLC